MFEPISPPVSSEAGFLARERTVAPPGYNRWLVPPAALAIHLAIGEVYSFTVLKLPLTKILDVDNASLNWTQNEIAHVFSIAIVVLGLSAALFGQWLERVGPRKAMLASASCFGSGFLVSAVGIYFHEIWLLYLGYGVLGGIGLGLGYISPVSTLIKWFPDRPGLATGLAIMGFGGGAMVGAPLSQYLLDYHQSSSTHGVVETFATMGIIYFFFMMFGVWSVRIPALNWRPIGSPIVTQHLWDTAAGLTGPEAIRTTRFWLLWAVLFLNVTAGIGLIEQAAPMIQEIFRGVVTPEAAAGFVGLISLFNMAGRFCWSSVSDYLGRQGTYAIFFAFGAALFMLTPIAGRSGSVAFFVICCVLIASMYGGGFATIPAYLKDQFGTRQVGAIHGRLLTAWSAAGIAGPTIVNELRIDPASVETDKVAAYELALHIMAALLVLGFICNICIQFFRWQPKKVQTIDKPNGEYKLLENKERSLGEIASAPEFGSLAFRWAWVTIPMIWGVSITVGRALALFTR